MVCVAATCRFDVLSAILPSVRGGLGDSVNPGSLFAGLIFSVVLYGFSLIEKRFRRVGLNFILGFWLTALFLASGLPDPWLTSDGYLLFVDIGYLVLCVAAILAGVVLLRDWSQSRFLGRPSKCWIPLPGGQAQTVSPKNAAGLSRIRQAARWSLYLTLSFWGGGIAAFLAAAWAPDVYVSVILSEMILPGKFGWSLLDLMFYSLAYVLPLILILVVSQLFGLSRGAQRVLCEKQSLLRVISAAVLLAYGGTYIVRYYF